MSKKKVKKNFLNYIKDIFNYISGLAGIILLTFKFQTNLSLNEFTTLLFILGGFFFIITIYLIIYYVRVIIDSLINNRLVLTNLIKFALSLVSMVIIIYFLINRTYLFLTYFYLILIYIPILTAFFLIMLTFIIRKSNFRKIHLLWEKIIIILIIGICFYTPFFLGATYPHSNPKVEISPKPMEIFYEIGNQVQDVQEINIYIKSMEANARNVDIVIQAPVDFYYWVDGIQNDSKTISFLSYDEVTHFLLEIQPSINVGNGTYKIGIYWSYESDLGNIYYRTTDIMVIIGPVVLEMYWLLIITLIMFISISIIFSIHYLIRKKKLKFRIQK